MKFVFCLLLICGLWLPAQATEKLSHEKLAHEKLTQVSFQSVTAWFHRQADAQVSYGPHPLQFGWLWQVDQSSNKPLVVIVHGGCWLNAFGVDHTFAMATALTAQGHPVWSLEYRRSGDPGGGWPGSLADVKLALSNLHALKPHGIDPDSLVLMGHSAGGHLALLAAADLPQLPIKQVIGLAAITDISRYALGDNSCQQATTQFMGGLPHEQPEAYHQANVLYRNLPAVTLLLQGDADRIVPVLQAQLHGVKSELVSGAGHFDWIHPDSAAFQVLLRHLAHE
ncbi:alpha/beta hydrolase family protein [Marinicella meishanensis]|uniref:alpha/beta hydrolase family protein n=1 Tax=Marinicella meishanensis TaxID=2873263 RepID=UPI001CBB6AB1|nr:alpha/beta hydrolase [Marinicella sp. NBU2979]